MKNSFLALVLLFGLTVCVAAEIPSAANWDTYKVKVKFVKFVEGKGGPVIPVPNKTFYLIDSNFNVAAQAKTDNAGLAVFKVIRGKKIVYANEAASAGGWSVKLSTSRVIIINTSWAKLGGP